MSTGISPGHWATDRSPAELAERASSELAVAVDKDTGYQRWLWYPGLTLPEFIEYWLELDFMVDLLRGTPVGEAFLVTGATAERDPAAETAAYLQHEDALFEVWLQAACEVRDGVNTGVTAYVGFDDDACLVTPAGTWYHRGFFYIESSQWIHACPLPRNE